MAKTQKSTRRVEPVRITTAPQSHRVDLEKRRRRYVVSMLIRSACFVGAIFVGSGWLMWLLIVGAVFLPYVAVIAANSAAPRIDGTDLQTSGPQYRELT